MSDVPQLPKVSTEVMRMARERHQKGLMHPYIFQILSQVILLSIKKNSDLDKKLCNHKKILSNIDYQKFV